MSWNKKQKVSALMALLIVAGAMAAGTRGVAAPDQTLYVRVDNVRLAKGMVHVSICTEAQFLKDCSWSGKAPAKVPSTIVAVPGVPQGRYGAQIYHDKNNNGKVDRNFLGIPREGVGFSNDAKIVLKPPRFADAAFQYNGGAQTILLKLRYF